MPPEINEILARASTLVTPTRSEAEKLGRVEEKVRSLLIEEFDKYPERTRPELSLGGSYAKGTWLKGSADIDFFLLYPKDFPREKLESEAIETAKNSVRGHELNMRFAEHPYVEVFFSGVRVNLVPCYKVEKGEWQSAADRSPFHAEYVGARYDEDLRLQARLLKKFVKSAGVYGAEVRVQGFSGYVCEVLVLKYGSFLGVLDQLSRATQGQVSSVEEYDVELAASFQSALVILDPVDTTRNLGSAISTENVAKLVLFSRKFLAKPSLSYFQKGRPAFRGVKNRELLSRILVVAFRSEERSVDILWGQLKKSCKSLASKMDDAGFSVLREGAVSNEKDESAFIFLLQEPKISGLQERQGPEFFRAKEVEKYLSKNRDRSILTWINGEGRLMSLTRRDPSRTDARTFLKEMLEDKTKLDKLGLSKTVRDDISRGFSVFSADKMRSGRKWLVEEVEALARTSGRELS